MFRDKSVAREQSGGGGDNGIGVGEGGWEGGREEVFLKSDGLLFTPRSDSPNNGSEG